MKLINFSQYKIKLIVLLTIAFIFSGCQTSQSVSSADLTRSECETDSSFVYIPGGEFISGSDRTERDFAYRISAAAIANTPENIEIAEQKLRQTG